MCFGLYEPKTFFNSMLKAYHASRFLHKIKLTNQLPYAIMYTSGEGNTPRTNAQRARVKEFGEAKKFPNKREGGASLASMTTEKVCGALCG